MSWRVGRVEVSRHNLQMFFCFVTDSFCDNLNKTLHLATKWKNNLARHQGCIPMGYPYPYTDTKPVSMGKYPYSYTYPPLSEHM